MEARLHPEAGGPDTRAFRPTGQRGHVLRWPRRGPCIHRSWRSSAERPLAYHVVSRCGCRSETARTAPGAVAQHHEGSRGGGFVKLGGAGGPTAPPPRSGDVRNRRSRETLHMVAWDEMFVWREGADDGAMGHGPSALHRCPHSEAPCGLAPNALTPLLGRAFRAGAASAV